VEGLSLLDLAARLALSERQLRREHSRALQALALRLWDRLTPPQRAMPLPALRLERGPEAPTESAAYPLIPRPVALDELLAGVAATFQPYAQAEGVALRLSLPDGLPPVLGDRVLLRSILLSLLRHAASYEPEGPILLCAEARSGGAELAIEFCPTESARTEQTEGPAWAAAQDWAAQLGATLSEVRPQLLQEKPLQRWTLTLPQAAQPVLLVVDDQPSAINLFRRYLSRNAFQVVGVTEPQQTLPASQQLRPAAIILDVMMPTVDGWEILQALRADPLTQQIPVIVCSVWDEPELASALGATLFLKKPVTKRDLLAALARLWLVEPPAGSPPGGP
jgi:CheY-like chemotaxis protein